MTLLENIEEANKKLAGKKIEKIEMSEVIAENFGTVPVIVLDDGTEIYASRDEEGNGPGALFIDKLFTSDEPDEFCITL